MGNVNIYCHDDITYNKINKMTVSLKSMLVNNWHLIFKNIMIDFYQYFYS